MAINLRDAVSVFTCISDIETCFLHLKYTAKNYFNASALFVRVTVSVWTLGHVVPVHTNKLFDKYNTGLGLNTMQGLEAKHQRLGAKHQRLGAKHQRLGAKHQRLGAKHQRLGAYSKNTTVKNRWQQVFRHKYMTLIWPREQNPFRDDYCKSSCKQLLLLWSSKRMSGTEV